MVQCGVEVWKRRPPLACPLISDLADLFALHWLSLSHELSGLSQSSRNPAALPSSAPVLPFLPAPAPQLHAPPPSQPSITSRVDQLALVSCGNGPFLPTLLPGNHKHTGQREVLAEARGEVRGRAPAEEGKSGSTNMIPCPETLEDGQRKATLQEVSGRSAQVSGVGLEESFSVWFLPPGWLPRPQAPLLCWLMLKASCFSFIRSVEGLTPARQTAPLPLWKRAV